MPYESTRKRDVAIIAIIAIVVFLVYYFVFREPGTKTVQAADAALFLCDNSRSVTAIWLPGQEGRVVLRLSHNPKVYLSGTTTANGELYNSADSKFTFWTKGSAASITENGKVTYADCEMMRFEE